MKEFRLEINSYTKIPLKEMRQAAGCGFGSGKFSPGPDPNGTLAKVKLYTCKQGKNI